MAFNQSSRTQNALNYAKLMKISIKASSNKDKICIFLFLIKIMIQPGTNFSVSQIFPTKNN